MQISQEADQVVWYITYRNTAHLLEWPKSGTLRAPNAGENVE